MTNYRILFDGMTFDNSAITIGSLKMTTAVDLVGAELSSDVFSVEVDYAVGEVLLWTPADYDGILTADGYWFGCEELTADLTTTPYGTPVYIYADGSLFAKFFTRNVVRTGRTKYRVSGMSAVGFLESQKHYGGLYNGALASSVISDIIGGAFTYTIEDDVANQAINGYLPIGTRRDNLHKVLFALGITLRKGLDGNIKFVFLRESAPTSVGDNKIFIGGDIDYSSPASSAETTEHSYYQTAHDEDEQLFDNTGIGETAASGTVIEFSEPHYDYAVSGGLVLDDSGVNYAVVTGTGTLTGKKYTHNTKTVAMQVAGGTNVADNVVSANDDTLINSLNSENILKRLTAYYGKKREIRADMIVSGIQSGDTVQFNDPFGDIAKGIISQMNLTSSSFIRSAMHIVTNYTPTGQGNYFDSFVIVKGSDLVGGNWEVPAAMQGKKARIVLFSGAQGGQGGWYGETTGLAYGKPGEICYSDGSDPWTVMYWKGLGDLPKGGAGGKGGNGGNSASRILEFQIDTLASSYPVVFGEGGAGGAGGTATRVFSDYGSGQWTAAQVAPEDGQDGADSTFGTYTTASGAEFGGTYINAVTGEVIAQVGENGTDGADGGDGGTSCEYKTFDTYADARDYDYSAEGKGNDGGGLDGYTGGTGANGDGGGNNVVVYDNTNWGYGHIMPQKYIRMVLSAGAGGGGAAMGSNGGNGVKAKYTQRSVSVTTVDKDGNVIGHSTYHIATFAYRYDEYTYDNRMLNVGGDGGDATIVPTQAVYRGGHGGHGGGGCGAGSQPMGYKFISLTSGGLYNLGVSLSGKGGNGGQGGKGSDGFFICYYNS